ncbi:uncharacterized protein LOC133287089 [Gastrolobium bilobum]|uniref:uncharacterized protein LOC133287089 n=1 Tax=Gastrolobium bilobum TaxID=150636 RepID=UPI002AB1BDF4|nr:uncharacterized protein LOC133287089 [Gastrolobium bilobum]
MLKNLAYPKYLGDGGLLLKNEWNYGEVLFVIPPDSGSSGSIKWTGVHVNRERTKAEDFRFTNPYPPKFNIVQRLSNFFLFLKTLRLRGSNLTILPECIEECHFLKLLDLCYCKQLREIRGLPISIDDFLAYNCTSLKVDCSTLNMIQSQAIRSATRKFYVLPRQRIPEWFDHSSRGNSLCFWFRKDFPCITVSAVLGVPDNGEGPIRVNFGLCGKINNIEIPLDISLNLKHDLVTDHIFMFKNFTVPNYGGLGGLLSENEWNYVEVLFMTPPDSDIWGSIKWTGVHVNREMTRMEDFRFTNPYPPKSKSPLGLLNPAIQMWIRSSMHSHWEQPLDEVYSNYASPNDGLGFSCIQPEWTTVLDGAFLDHQAKDPGQSSPAPDFA